MLRKLNLVWDLLADLAPDVDLEVVRNIVR